MSHDVTLFIAHPDDEAIFGWPVLDSVKHIVCVSSDINNEKRFWCSKRGECLQDVAHLLGASLTIGEFDSEFYRLTTRVGELKSLATRFEKYLMNAEAIFTHNPWGEYGHLDHILCHHIARTVQTRTQCTLLVSDIHQEINWLPIRPWPLQHAEAELAGRSALVQAVHEADQWRINRPLYDRIKAIYDARGCWTWAWEPQEKCRVYSI